MGRSCPRLGWVVVGLLGACVDNPYVIGRVIDGDDCARASALDAGVLACSGFEKPGFRDWAGTEANDGGVLMRTAAMVHGGSAALRAESRAAERFAVVVQDFEPLLDGELHLRVHVWVPGGLATETMNILFIGDEPNPSEDPDGPFVGVDINLANDGALQLFSPQNDPSRITGNQPIPRDRWFCLQLSMQIAHADAARPGAIALSVDGREALSASPFETLPEAGVSRVRAGIDWSSEQAAPFEVYMDDLVVSRKPLPCTL